MTYSVKWLQTDVTFARRFEVYLDYPFFEHQVIFSHSKEKKTMRNMQLSACLLMWKRKNVNCNNRELNRPVLFESCSKVLTSMQISNVQIHWFSIFNSFMMVIFLTGLVSMILMRTLRNDYAKYAREDDDLESLVYLPFV